MCVSTHNDSHMFVKVSKVAEKMDGTFTSVYTFFK